jgi:sulfate transport system permease protein
LSNGATLASASPAASEPPAPPRHAHAPLGKGTLLGLGIASTFLSVMVLIPLAAVAVKSMEGGFAEFWDAVTSPQAIAALRLTLLLSFFAVLINAVMGTVLAWVLVRDRFPGRRLMDAVIDLPFALPTIVAGLTLLSLYGPNGPVGVNIAFTRIGIVMALVFVTMPFVVRAVQPVLMELDREMEEAAASLGAGKWTTFRRVILPNLLPAMVAGTGLAFARALGEFGAVVLIAGNIPYSTEVASVFIFGQIESDGVQAAAAVSVVLLGASMAVLLLLAFVERFLLRHAR